MDEHVQRHIILTYMVEHDRRYFSGIKGLVNFFSEKALNVSNSKVLTMTEIPVVKSYSREAYLTVILLLISDQSS